jgi:glycosyltransferase involved in cell wall biosynthesis
MKPVVIIPAYNPDEKLIDLVDSLKRAGLTVVVVMTAAAGSAPGFLRC